MHYLVTGGAGFIGSNTAEELIRREHTVCVLDDLSTGDEDNLATSRGKINFIRGSVTDKEALNRACRGADYVLHLAARTSVPHSIENPLETDYINVDGTLLLLMAARDAGVRRVVFASSCAIYGEASTLPIREEVPPSPISPYGASKLAAEHYGNAFHRVYGLEFVSLRYFNVFGPRQDPGSSYSGVLARFCRAICDGEAPFVHGDGEQSRDFVFVENIVRGNVLAFETPGISGMAFNIGTGVRHSLNQTLKLLSKFSGRDVGVKYGPTRAGDIRDSEADISLAREKLGFDPRMGFEEGLRRTWDWYCGQR